MTRDTLSSAVDRFYQAFRENKPDLLTDVATKDFKIEIPKLEYVPLQHTYVGIAGFKQLLKDREGRIEYTKFDELDRIVGDNAVAVCGHTEGNAVVQGRTFSHNWVHVFWFVGGRVTVFKEYVDASEASAALAP
jgi:ketosteroid isomerase-like protein